VVRTREEEAKKSDKIASFDKQEQIRELTSGSPKRELGDPGPPININEDIARTSRRSGA